ncbi:PAS domain-containing protein [Sediminicola sp. 1XM1-17]|uniref:PAS domain-containing protein n=1 Tax=Sediminicola sp. 1XM1-17 TaxID=3127702 RepID=UPI00307882C3
MENNSLDTIAPMLDLAKLIGGASAVGFSHLDGDGKISCSLGSLIRREDQKTLGNLVAQTLSSSNSLDIIFCLKKVGLEPLVLDADHKAISGHVGCPIKTREGVALGVLHLFYAQTFQLTAEQEKALLTVASQISTTLEAQESEKKLQLVQEELAMQKKVNRNIVMNSKLSLWTCNLKKQVLYFDPKWAQLLGYSETELQPLTMEKWESMIHAGDLEGLKDNWKDYLKGHIDHYEVAYRIKHKDGSWKWFLVASNTLIRDKEGIVVEMVGTIEDITQQKQDYTKLEEAMQRLTYLSKATSDAIWDLDLVKETLHWNDIFFETYGHKPDEYAKAGLTLWAENIHPEDRVRVEASFEKSLEEDHETWEEEYRFKKADGNFVIVNDKAFIIRNANGKAVRMVGAICDITERNNYVLKAKIANKRFQRIADLTKEVIYDWDIINEDVYWGSGYEKHFGHQLPKRKVTLQTRINHMHPEDVQRVLGLLKDLLRNPDENYFEAKYRYLKGDGTYIDIHEKASILRNDHGGPFRMVGSMRDVSEENRYLEKLRDSEKKYNDLFHLSPQPSWVYDLETLKFLDVNSAAVDCYGYSREEFMELTLSDIRPEGEITPLMKEIADVRTNARRVFNGAFKHRKKNGEVFDVRIHSNPITFKERVCRQVVAFDISGLTKHIETIESQNIKFNKIAWMQSHVLRAPLVRMMGLTNLLLDPEENNEGDQEFLLKEIRNASNEIDQITRDIAQITNDLKTNQLYQDE